MSRLKILTSFNIELDFETAEFHKRLFAWVIDVIIALIYFFLAVKIVDSIAPGMSGNNGDSDLWAIFLILILPISLYPLITEITMNGQTIGKKLLGLKVINETGGNATISQFLIRWMLRTSDLFAVLLILVILARDYYIARALIFTIVLLITDIICIIATKKSQRLGDMAAGAILINTRSKMNLEETVFVETEDTYVPLYPEVMKLSDRDMNVIKTVLNSVSKKSNQALADRTASKVQSVLKIQPQQGSVSFLETLLKDYNHLSTR